MEPKQQAKITRLLQRRWSSFANNSSQRLLKLDKQFHIIKFINHGQLAYHLIDVLNKKSYNINVDNQNNATIDFSITYNLNAKINNIAIQQLYDIATQQQIITNALKLSHYNEFARSNKTHDFESDFFNDYTRKFEWLKYNNEILVINRHDQSYDAQGLLNFAAYKVRLQNDQLYIDYENPQQIHHQSILEEKVKSEIELARRKIISAAEENKLYLSRAKISDHLESFRILKYVKNHQIYYYAIDCEENIEGGFSKIYKAYPVTFDQGQLVKIDYKNPKILKIFNETATPELLEKTKKEAKRFNKYLGNQSADEPFVIDNKIIILQPHLPGETLKSFLDKVYQDEIKLSFAERIDLLAQISEQLLDLHNKNIIHRDLWDNNILIRKDGNKYKLLFIDFGESAKAKQTYEIIKCEPVGPYRLPPESANGYACPKSDVYILQSLFLRILGVEHPEQFKMAMLKQIGKEYDMLIDVLTPNVFDNFLLQFADEIETLDLNNLPIDIRLTIQNMLKRQGLHDLSQRASSAEVAEFFAILAILTSVSLDRDEIKECCDRLTELSTLPANYSLYKEKALDDRVAFLRDAEKAENLLHEVVNLTALYDERAIPYFSLHNDFTLIRHYEYNRVSKSFETKVCLINHNRKEAYEVHFHKPNANEIFTLVDYDNPQPAGLKQQLNIFIQSILSLAKDETKDEVKAKAAYNKFRDKVDIFYTKIPLSYSEVEFIKVKGVIFAINRQEKFTDDNGNVSYYGYKVAFNDEGQLNFKNDKLQLIDSKDVLKAKFDSEQAEIKKALITNDQVTRYISYNPADEAEKKAKKDRGVSFQVFKNTEQGQVKYYIADYDQPLGKPGGYGSVFKAYPIDDLFYNVSFDSDNPYDITYEINFNTPKALKAFNQDTQLLGPFTENQFNNLTKPNSSARFEINNNETKEHFIIMDEIPGKTLQQFFEDIAQGRAQPNYDNAIKIAKNLAAKLKEFHDIESIDPVVGKHHLIHGDLSAKNIMINGDVITIFDYGTVKKIKSGENEINFERSEPDRMFGTPVYVAPEFDPKNGMQVHLSQNTDIYTIAAVFLLLFGAKNPFAQKYQFHDVFGELSLDVNVVTPYNTEGLFENFPELNDSRFEEKISGFNLKNTLNLLLERMGLHKKELRPTSAELLEFFTTLCDINELAKDFANNLAQITRLAAKLAVIASGVWQFAPRADADVAHPLLTNIAANDKPLFQNPNFSWDPNNCEFILQAYKEHNLNQFTLKLALNNDAPIKQVVPDPDLAVQPVLPPDSPYDIAKKKIQAAEKDAKIIALDGNDRIIDEKFAKRNKRLITNKKGTTNSDLAKELHLGYSGAAINILHYIFNKSPEEIQNYIDGLKLKELDKHNYDANARLLYIHRTLIKNRDYLMEEYGVARFNDVFKRVTDNILDDLKDYHAEQTKRAKVDPKQFKTQAVWDQKTALAKWYYRTIINKLGCFAFSVGIKRDAAEIIISSLKTGDPRAFCEKGGKSAVVHRAMNNGNLGVFSKVAREYIEHNAKYNQASPAA